MHASVGLLFLEERMVPERMLVAVLQDEITAGVEQVARQDLVRDGRQSFERVGRIREDDVELLPADRQEVEDVGMDGRDVVQAQAGGLAADEGGMLPVHLDAVNAGRSAGGELEGDGPRAPEEVENLQVYSVDEAFFRMPHEDVETCHRLMAELVKKIRQYVGIPVSVGFAPSRTLAKVANHIAKRDRRITDGVYWLVRPEAIEVILRRTPIEDVWGIGRRLAASLQAQGIKTAADFVKMPPSLVRSQYSVTLERTQRELMGHDCQIANPVTIAHKTIMTSRTFGKVITDRDEIADAIVSFAERTAWQLRDEGSVAGSVMAYVRGDRFREDLPFYSNSCQVQLDTPSNDTMTIVRQALNAFSHIWRDGYAYRKAGVMALDIEHGGGIQLNLFDPEDHGKLRRLMTSIDGINNMYGSRSVKLTPSLHRGQWSPNQNHFNTRSKTLHFYTGMVYQ